MSLALLTKHASTIRGVLNEVTLTCWYHICWQDVQSAMAKCGSKPKGPTRRELRQIWRDADSKESPLGEIVHNAPRQGTSSPNQMAPRLLPRSRKAGGRRKPIPVPNLLSPSKAKKMKDDNKKIRESQNGGDVSESPKPIASTLNLLDEVQNNFKAGTAELQTVAERLIFESMLHPVTPPNRSPESGNCTAFHISGTNKEISSPCAISLSADSLSALSTSFAEEECCRDPFVLPLQPEIASLSLAKANTIPLQPSSFARTDTTNEERSPSVSLSSMAMFPQVNSCFTQLEAHTDYPNNLTVYKATTDFKHPVIFGMDPTFSKSDNKNSSNLGSTGDVELRGRSTPVPKTSSAISSSPTRCFSTTNEAIPFATVSIAPSKTGRVVQQMSETSGLAASSKENILECRNVFEPLRDDSDKLEQKCDRVPSVTQPLQQTRQGTTGCLSSVDYREYRGLLVQAETAKATIGTLIAVSESNPDAEKQNGATVVRFVRRTRTPISSCLVPAQASLAAGPSRESSSDDARKDIWYPFVDAKPLQPLEKSALSLATTHEEGICFSDAYPPGQDDTIIVEDNKPRESLLHSHLVDSRASISEHPANSSARVTDAPAHGVATGLYAPCGPASQLGNIPQAQHPRRGSLLRTLNLEWLAGRQAHLGLESDEGTITKVDISRMEADSSTAQILDQRPTKAHTAFGRIKHLFTAWRFANALHEQS